MTAVTFESDRGAPAPAVVLGHSCLPVRQSGNSWTDVGSFVTSTMSEPASVACVTLLVAFHNADDLHHTAQSRTSLTRNANRGNVTVIFSGVRDSDEERCVAVSSNTEYSRREI